MPIIETISETIDRNIDRDNTEMDLKNLRDTHGNIDQVPASSERNRTSSINQIAQGSEIEDSR